MLTEKLVILANEAVSKLRLKNWAKNFLRLNARSGICLEEARCFDPPKMQEIIVSLSFDTASNARMTNFHRTPLHQIKEDVIL